MTDSVDKMYFQELAAQDPPKICRRTSSKYDETNRCYTITVWNDEYAVYPHGGEITRLNGESKSPHDLFYLFVIYCLLREKGIPTTGHWISEKDIPGGATFFRGPHAIPTHLISCRYENNIDGFKKRCEQLQGTPLNLADAGYRFEITPRIPVAVLYWAGDEDFPAEAKILYDKSISERFPPDVVFSLAVEICVRIGRAHG